MSLAEKLAESEAQLEEAETGLFFTIRNAVFVSFCLIAAAVGIFIPFQHNPPKNTTKENFVAACQKVGGETVFDGRQYTCIK